MSISPVIPEKSTSGIAVDPRTLNRVVPESRRPDGSIRKEIKIRPGFTPQEDVTRFRGTRQTQMDRNALPKGHIFGWVAPSSASKSADANASKSKNAKKNEKRKDKRDKKKEEIIRANWEDDNVVKDVDGAPNWAETAKAQHNTPEMFGEDGTEENGKKTTGAATGSEDSPTQSAEDLNRQVERLEIR